MHLFKAVPAILFIGAAYAQPTLERRESSRAACLQNALSIAKPWVRPAAYFAAVCYIGASTLDLNDDSMVRVEPWYKHLFYQDCDGARAHCFLLGINNKFTGDAPAGPDNIAYYIDDPAMCGYKYGPKHVLGCANHRP